VDHEEWLAAHKGPLLRTVGEVWWCGDDYCDCTQAQIVEIYRNKVVQPGVVRIAIWQGAFFTEGEPGAYEELQAKRAKMKGADPGAEAEIEWEGTA
jgi:hypothetical protein